MVKLTGCNFSGCDVDVSLPQGMTVECLKCGHKEKTADRVSGSISCPKCGSSDIEVTGEKK